MWSFYWTLVASFLFASTGLTGIIVHVGRDDSELQAVMVSHEPWGSAWRQRDYDVLMSPEFRKALKDNNVILITCRELKKLVQ